MGEAHARVRDAIGAFIARGLSAMAVDVPNVRDAATVILWRNAEDPEVLMGQRGAAAAFMPSKYVFPGGAVDAADAEVSLAASIGQEDHGRLAQGTSDTLPHALAVAAIRELWEETGLRIGVAGTGPLPAGWEGFAEHGLRPTAAPLRFILRAITPKGRPRRFDARFFLVAACDAQGDAEAFSDAGDELNHLHWVRLSDARGLDLPFITEVVLAEVARRLRNPDAKHAVPFFDGGAEDALFHCLGRG